MPPDRAKSHHRSEHNKLISPSRKTNNFTKSTLKHRREKQRKTDREKCENARKR